MHYPPSQQGSEFFFCSPLYGFPLVLTLWHPLHAAHANV